jgi:hypothetical protein
MEFAINIHRAVGINSPLNIYAHFMILILKDYDYEVLGFELG